MPDGGYDVTPNRGTVYVGAAGATAPFAVDVRARCWKTEGRTTDPTAARLLLLAEGGSTGSRSRSHLCCGSRTSRSRSAGVRGWG